MAETAELQEPPAWGEIVRDEVFQQAPAEEKNRIFDAWEQDNRAFAKTLGATDDELDAFHNDLRTRWSAQMATIGAGQAMDAATLPVRAAAAYAETPQGRAETAQGLEVEAENLRAQANVLEQEQEARGFGTQEPRKLRNQAADLRMRAAQINPQVLPLEQLGVNTPDDRVSPIRSFLGPAVSAQAESPMGRGLTSTLGGTAGGAIGAATFAAPFTGGTSLLMGLGGGLLGGAVGSSGQEVVMQAMEDPEQTAQRQQETARAAQESPGLFTVGRLLNTSAIFRPSLTETRAAIAGAPGARLNLAATAGIGAGVEGSAAAMRGEPVLPAALGGIMENVLFSRPTALGQRLGFRPSEFQPNRQTDTVRTPIGTIDPQGRIVEPGSPEGTALQALEGLHSVEPTTITPDAQQISQTSPPDGGMRPSQVPPQDGPLSTPERGEGVQPGRQGEGMAPAPPETAQPLTVQDIVPAIRVAGQVVRGNRGETHQDILNRLKTENPDAYAEALVDFDTKENPNFFVGPDDTPISREQLQQQFGVRDSQGLRDLQAKEPEAAPEPSVAEPVPSEGTKSTQQDIQQIAEGEPTGMRNAVVDQARIQREMTAREAPVRRSYGPLWDETKALVAQQPQAGSQLVDNLKQQMRPLTDAEDALLTHEQTQREAELDAATEQMNNARTQEEKDAAQLRLDSALNAQYDVYNVGQSAGTANARGLAARRLMINRDYTLARMMARTRAEVNRGEPLNKEQQAEVTALHQKISEQEKTIADLQAKRAEDDAKKEFQRLLRSAKRESEAPQGKRRSLVDFLNEQEAKAKARILARRGRLLSTVDPLNIAGLVDEAIVGTAKLARGIRDFAEWSKAMLADFGERIRPQLQALFQKSQELEQEQQALFRDAPESPSATGAQPDGKVISDLIHSYVKEGVTDLAPAIQRATKELQQVYPGITERQVQDAFSGYGKTTTPSKEADLVQLRELRNLARLTSQLQDAQAGLAPLKTGPQRDKATARVRDLQKQVNDAIRKAGIQTTSPEQQLATAHTQRVTRLQNALEEVELQMAQGKRTERGEPVPWTPEELALRDKLVEARARLDDALNEPDSDKLRSIMSRLAIAKERLKTGNITGPARTQGADTEAVAIARRELDTVNKELADLRKARRVAEDPPKTPDEIRLHQMGKRRDALLEKVAKQDLSTKTGVPRADTQQQAQVRSEIQQLNTQIRDLRSNSEELRLAAAKKRVQSRIDTIQKRIAAGDYEPKQPRTPVSDKELTQAQFELAKAKELFNKGLIEARMAKRSTGRKVIDTGQEILNASRALLTSADLSAVLRQGGFIGLGNPVRAARALPDMFRAMASERAQFRVMEEIASRPNAPLYEQGKLYLAKEGNSLNELEEAFMSRWAQKIPGVRASQRAYNTFLNKLRADTFDSMVEGLGAGTPEEIRAIANYINAATGRGKLGLKSLENNAAALNTFFFAPRFVASRFQMLAGQPLYGGSARTRKLIATEYAKYLAGVSVVMALGLAAGATLESDPRSSLFGKLKFGNTLLDPLSGLAQNTTLVSRLASGETKTIRGKVVPIRGERIPFGSGDSATVIGRFLRTKLSPSVGAGFDLATGRNVIGERVTPADVAVRAVVPISFQEILTTMEQQGVPRGTSLTVLSLFGMGLQNLEQRR